MCEFVRKQICKLVIIDYGGIIESNRNDWLISSYPPYYFYSGNIDSKDIDIFSIVLEIIYNIIIIFLVCSDKSYELNLSKNTLFDFMSKSVKITMFYSNSETREKLKIRKQAFKNVDSKLYSILGNFIGINSKSNIKTTKHEYTGILEKLIDYFSNLKVS